MISLTTLNLVQEWDSVLRQNLNLRYGAVKIFKVGRASKLPRGVLIFFGTLLASHSFIGTKPNISIVFLPMIRDGLNR